jgi:DNA (cytosine-5)-methyltransferase 1
MYSIKTQNRKTGDYYMYSVGSVCSGIEAASVAWNPLGFNFKWFSEIADFPSRVLKEKYPDTPNVGDMNDIPELIRAGDIFAPDVICGGTPCQAFSLAGQKNGLNDLRGNLTMRFIDIVEANDEIRANNGHSQSIVFWENVEGVLTDKTNAFGSLIASLAGLDEIPHRLRWSTAGVVKGNKRNVAWRVLDAKYFGIPQQRRRLYLVAGGKDFSPEDVLFENTIAPQIEYPTSPLTFVKKGHRFEVFREYTDCLYSAYGTKWNGNAAAYNGSLYVVQDERIRRLSPLECERLMGFPDNYTNLPSAKRTNRYQAIGNSWAVPVVKWIGERLRDYENLPVIATIQASDDYLCEFESEINVSAQPENCVFSKMSLIISPEAPVEIYISPTGCYGIVRRKNERNLRINPRLEEVLLKVSSKWSADEIERRSRVQKRGRFSDFAKFEQQLTFADC